MSKHRYKQTCRATPLNAGKRTRKTGDVLAPLERRYYGTGQSKQANSYLASRAVQLASVNMGPPRGLVSLAIWGPLSDIAPLPPPRIMLVRAKQNSYQSRKYITTSYSGILSDCQSRRYTRLVGR